MRRPVLARPAPPAVLLALAAPVLRMSTGTGALDQFPSDHETRAGLEAAAALTGPGAPRRSRSSSAATTPAAAAARVRAALRRGPGHRARRRAGPARDGERRARHRRRRATTASPLRPRRPSSGCATRCRPRPDRAPRSTSAASRRRSATSPTWSAARCGRSCCSCSALSYLVLLVLLRSVVLPLKAVLMNLLSVGAAFGVLSLVYDTGRHAHAAARAGGRLRPVDGLRGVPALAHPRALRGDRRHAHARSPRAWPRARGRSRRRR